MSLPSQRPNYVLVWIGIVMLTFSMTGNWFLGSSSKTSTNVVDSARLSMDYEDSAFLPLLHTAEKEQASATTMAVESVFDQQISVQTEDSVSRNLTYASHEIPLGPQVWEASLPGTEVLGEKRSSSNELPRALRGVSPVGDDSMPQSEQLHSFHRMEAKTGTPRTRKQKAADSWNNQGQYNSSWSNRNGLANRGKKGMGHDREVFIRTRFHQIPNGRIVASFFLAHPNAQGRLQKLQGDLDQDLELRAEQYLAALETVIVDSENDTLEGEAQSHKQQELARIYQMQAKLREHLRQRPGGIELVAELSPGQLEALLQKLSAQNPRFVR